MTASGVNFEDLTNRLKQLMVKDNGGLNWSKEHNSKFEVSKSVIVHFTRKTAPDPETDRGCIPLEKPKLLLGGQEVTQLDCFKYLGVQIDTQLR
jgi:hypothetical protein